MRELLGEMKLLTANFPDLHDSFDDDDLPIMFRIRRDAGATETPAPEPGRSARRPSARKLAKPQRGRVKT
jgi:hypothetical protein